MRAERPPCDAGHVVMVWHIRLLLELVREICRTFFDWVIVL